MAICDDEAAQLTYLSDQVRGWARRDGNSVRLSLFPSGEAFWFQYEQEKDFDLLLLDIEMGKISGVELARRIRRENADVQILFITAYPDFMAEGYEVAALERAAANLKKAERYEIFCTGGETVRISLGEIVSVEAFSHEVEVTARKGSFRVEETISGLEKRLGDGFVRCHRSYLAALKYVRKITRTDVVMDTGARLPLSRRRYDAVNQAFIHYYREEGGDG